MPASFDARDYGNNSVELETVEKAVDDLSAELRGASTKDLTALDAQLTSILNKLSSDPATEATLGTLATDAKLEAVRLLLASVDGKDFATNTTLATLATEATLEAARVLLASLDGKDFATQTTAAAILAKLSGDPATQTTLAALLAEMEGKADTGEQQHVDVKAITLPTALYNGEKTVTTAGTAEALAATQELTSGVTIRALDTNTGKVYVGASGVAAANGYALAAGDEVFVEVADLAAVYVDVATSGEGVRYIAS